MNFFLDQGRCRVCGRIFCCSIHQREHEKLEHEEYAKLLEILPTCCRNCGKRMSTIADLSSKCILFNRSHCLTSNSFSGTPKASRKRHLDENLFQCVPDGNADLRRRLVPLHKQFASKELAPLVFDLSERRIRNAANTFISPQLNVSYKFLKTDAKSSTPLNEDDAKEMAISVSVQQEATTYCTPENAIGTSLILVSAMKKCSSQRKADGRKVTFDTASPSDEEISVYGTPPVTFTEQTFTHEMVIVSPAVDENVESNFSDLSKPEYKLAKVAKNVRLSLNGIPRSLTSIWEWTQRRIRRKKQRDEFDSPVSLRKIKTNLKRKPISSYWVSMSITSLVRDPLPNYKEKYAAAAETK